MTFTPEAGPALALRALLGPTPGPPQAWEVTGSDARAAAVQTTLERAAVGNVYDLIEAFRDALREWPSPSDDVATPRPMAAHSYDGMSHAGDAGHDALVPDQSVRLAVAGAADEPPLQLAARVAIPSERGGGGSGTSGKGGADRPLPPGAPVFASGEPFEDRRSVFQAHVAAVHSIEDVRVALAWLKSDKKIARATHNIMAYRIAVDSSSAGRVLQDNDDDGETAAGSRLAHLLDVLGVQNVLVVVSRWFGGIQLGPDRFKHINNVARQQLEAAGYLRPPAADGGSAKAARKRK